MKGEGYGNLANKKHSVVIQEQSKKSRKRKMKTKDCQRKRGKRGKHWITIRISKSHVELFDSLGLIHHNCLSTDILAFIQRFAVSRTFIFNKPIQPRNSILCGFYSIFYVFVRQHCSFKSIESFFSYKLSDNDAIIKSFFYTLNIFYSEYK